MQPDSAITDITDVTDISMQIRPCRGLVDSAFIQPPRLPIPLA